MEGTYTMQKNWIEQHQLGWNPRTAQLSAQEMYKRIFYMKFLPPGRGNKYLKFIKFYFFY